MQIDNSSLDWLGTGTSIKSGGIKQVLCNYLPFVFVVALLWWCQLL
jgi:hypothetical protein